MASKLVNAVIGSTQSKYAAMILSITVFLLCMSILFMESDYTFGKKLFAILLILLMLLPGLILTLVEITCIVTGAQNGKNWWCSLLAWVIAIFIFIYCIMILVTSVNSHYTYKTAGKKVSDYDKGKVMTQEEANDVAQVMLQDDVTGMPYERPSVRPPPPGVRPPPPGVRPPPPGVRPPPPSARPVTQPSARPPPPSARPVAQPSARPPPPGARPVAQPSARPIAQPGARPVAQPSARPVAQPGARPVAQPSARPVAQPSVRPPPPSARPVAQPGARPPPPPSARPVAQPNARPPPPSARPVAQPGSIPPSATLNQEPQPMEMGGIETFSRF